MITEAILGVLADVVSWVLGLFPTLDIPAYLTGTGPGTLRGQLDGALTLIWGIDSWVSVDAIFAVATISSLAFVAQWVIKILRVVSSYLTAGGGSAA